MPMDMPEVLGDDDAPSEGPPPCQDPDCDAEAIPETEHTYCGDHDRNGDDSDEPEPDVAEVELSDEDLGDGGDLFDGLEGASEDAGDSETETGNVGTPLDALDDRGEALEDAVNDGAARLAVVGLEDNEREGLEDEMREVFEAFRLGYFGAEFAEEYIFVQGEDSIDPAWGFAGAAFACLGVCLWMRPDGDEQFARMKDALGGLAGGDGL